MEHEHWLEEISAALDGELSAGEQAELEAHLAQCPQCRALMAELGGMGAALSSLEAQPPDGLQEKVLEGVRRPKVTPLRRRWAGMAAMVAVVFLCGLVWLAGGPRSGEDGGLNVAQFAAGLPEDGSGSHTPAPSGVPEPQQRDTPGEAENGPVESGWGALQDQEGEEDQEAASIALAAQVRLTALPEGLEDQLLPAEGETAWYLPLETCQQLLPQWQEEGLVLSVTQLDERAEAAQVPCWVLLEVVDEP